MRSRLDSGSCMATEPSPINSDASTSSPPAPDLSKKNKINVVFHSTSPAGRERERERVAALQRAKSLQYGNAALRINLSAREEKREETELKHDHDEEAVDEEHGDPYLGLGAGHTAPLPLELVFRLMNAGRFKEISEQEFRGRTKLFRLLLCIGVLSVAAGFVYYLVLLDFQIDHHPRPAIPAVEFMEMMYGQVTPVDPEEREEQQRSGKGDYHAYTLRLIMFCILNITNPNKNVDFYHADLEMTVLYRGLPIGYGIVEDVFHPRSSLIQPEFFIGSMGVPMPLREGYTLEPEIESYNFKMVAEVITHSTMVRTAGLRSQRFRIRFRCQLYQMPTGELSQDCNYASADKWYSRNEELKKYA